MSVSSDSSSIFGMLTHQKKPQEAVVRPMRQEKFGDILPQIPPQYGIKTCNFLSIKKSSQEMAEVEVKELSLNRRRFYNGWKC